MSDGMFSQIRQDPVSRDWVIIATGRAQRPHEFKRQSDTDEDSGTDRCPFCKLDPFERPEESGNEVLATFPADDDSWWIKVIKNKYPVVHGTVCGTIEHVGPYSVQEGAGNHEVVITRDHRRSIAQMSHDEVEQLVAVYQRRYETLRPLDCARYILIFHNHGVEAGASIFHPHSQVMAIPVVPADVQSSLSGSRAHHDKTGECVHCAMIRFERAEKKRVVFENNTMVAVVPFVSRNPFEIRIYPKHHESYFEHIDAPQRRDLAEALQVSLSTIHKGLNDLAYNFFIHTAPAHEPDQYSFYHWHVEILPKPPTPKAGFELGTGIDVCPVDPDDAAEYLREYLHHA